MNIRAIRESDFIVINIRTNCACFADRKDIAKHIPAGKPWACNGGELDIVDNVHTMRVKYQDKTICTVKDIFGGEA